VRSEDDSTSARGRGEALGSRNLNISKGSAAAAGDHDRTRRICIMRHNVPGRLSTHVPFEFAGAALTGHTLPQYSAKEVIEME
jgi:hypothetical protein